MGVKITYSVPLNAAIEDVVKSIRQQVEARSYDAANELRNSSLEILRGQRNGRRYRVPGKKTYYTASAPGEPPANRLGHFRMSWQPNTRAEDGVYTSMIESDLKVGTSNQHLLGDILEEGTANMAPRPYQELITDRAIGKIKRIYSAPYFDGGTHD